ncbi:stage V sporulation protein B, partial [Bacillus altitudinis]|nr:stage V sporulation protein B [Bacillus altitudinis]
LCVLVIIGTGAVSLWMKHQASGLFSAPLELVMMIFLTCMLYVILLICLGLVKREELRRIPFIGKLL